MVIVAECYQGWQCESKLDKWGGECKAGKKLVSGKVVMWGPYSGKLRNAICCWGGEIWCFIAYIVAMK